MTLRLFRPPSIALTILAAIALSPASLPLNAAPDKVVNRVLLISIDGMHALDFQNCSNGISSVKYGTSYCPIWLNSATAESYTRMLPQPSLPIPSLALAPWPLADCPQPLACITT